MNINEITTVDLLKLLGVNFEIGLPQKGVYPCELELSKQNLKCKVDQLFAFHIFDSFSGMLSIEIPNALVLEIYNNNYKFEREKLKLLLEYIHMNKTETNNYSDPLVSVCFSILHEFGHWYYFIESEMDINKYKTWDEGYREANRNLKGTEREIFEDYRRIPSEKAADEFAFINLMSFLRRIMDNSFEIKEPLLELLRK